MKKGLKQWWLMREVQYARWCMEIESEFVAKLGRRREIHLHGDSSCQVWQSDVRSNEHKVQKVYHHSAKKMNQRGDGWRRSAVSECQEATKRQTAWQFWRRKKENTYRCVHVFVRIEFNWIRSIQRAQNASNLWCTWRNWDVGGTEEDDLDDVPRCRGTDTL